MTWKHGILYFAALAMLAAFPWGPLFAWSPVHPGYTQARFSRADVVYPRNTALDPAYRELDRYVATAEDFHEMKCPKRIKIVVCGSWGDYLRFAVPFVGGQRPLAITLATGTVIFVTPKAAFGVDIGGLLRHELSHAVLSQNRSLWSVLRMLKQPWVNEGIAGVVAGMGETAPGRQLVSLPEAQFLARARTEDLWPCFAAASQKDWRFSYTAWLYFWDRQIKKNGKSTFLTFERACTSDPDGCRKAFASVYGTALHKAVDEFRDEVRSGRVTPPDRIGG
jgi:hypothetical protein